MEKDQTQKRDPSESAAEAEADPARQASSDQGESGAQDTDAARQYDAFMRVIRR